MDKMNSIFERYMRPGTLREGLRKITMALCIENRTRAYRGCSDQQMADTESPFRVNPPLRSGHLFIVMVR